MAETAVLNLVLWLPVLGMGLLLLAPHGSESFIRRISLATMLVQAALCAWLYARFDAGSAGLQFETRLPWIADWASATRSRSTAPTCCW